MPRPYFVADQATVTVLKPVASSAFGSYKLSVPEDVDIDDIYQFAAPGNELGYVASLAPAGQRVGGFARRFVRADVSVTAADTTDPDWVPSSDVDKVLTEAAARVEGDFFLESDITKAGLGPWIPFTHFEQGDLATVEIWGRRVPLPVTRIEPKVTDHDENDWAVHVGGQVLTDDEARLAENEALRQAAVQSRREVAGLESQTAKAVSTADSANAKSDQALKAATDADGTIQSKLDEQRRLSSEFSVEVTRAESAAASASDAFRQVDSLVNSPEGAFRQGVASALAAQDDVNQSQQQINATQSNINRQQGEINTALSQATTAAKQTATDAKKATDAVSTTTRIVNAQQDSAIKLAQNAAYLQAQTAVQVAMTRGNQFVDNDLISGYLSSESWGIGGTKLSKVTFTAKGDWAGQLAVQIITTSGDVDYKNYGVGPGHRGTSFSTEGPVNIGGVVITIQIHYGNSPRKFAIVTNPAQPIISDNGGVKMSGFQADSGIYRNVIEGNPVDVRTSGHLQFPSLTVKPDSPVYKLSPDLKSATKVNAGVSIPAGTWILAARDPDNLTRVVEFST